MKPTNRLYSICQIRILLHLPKFLLVISIFLLLLDVNHASHFAHSDTKIEESSNEILSPTCRLSKIGVSRMYAEVAAVGIPDDLTDHFQNDDLISFVNYGASDVDLSGWELYVDQFGTGSPVFTFPSSLVVAPCQEITVIADWDEGLLGLVLPVDWFDADIGGFGEGFFSDDDPNANYAILRNPNSNEYISFNNEVNPTTLSVGTMICETDVSTLVPNNFDACQLIYWEDFSSQYSQLLDCALPTFYTTCLEADIESISNYTGYGVSCAGGNDGWIKAKASGGTPPYSFEWRDPFSNIISSGPVDSIFGLTAGSYSVAISDASTFLGSFNTTLQEPTQLQSLTQVLLPYSGQALSCVDANDGKAYVFSWSGAITFTTGVAPYDYVWSNGQTGDTLRNVGAGTYRVTTTDVNGCTDVDTVVIANPADWSVDISVSIPLSCDDIDNGQLQALASPSAGSVTYEWNTGAVGNVISGLDEGTYWVTATSNPGCERTDTITISRPLPLAVDFTSTLPSSCGNTDGEIRADINGGTPPYNFVQWNTGFAGDTLPNVPEGEYSLTVVDSIGCSNTFFYTFSDPSCIIDESTCTCLLYTSPSPRDRTRSRMPSSA